MSIKTCCVLILNLVHIYHLYSLPINTNWKAPTGGTEKEWLQSWFKIIFYCPGYIFFFFFFLKFFCMLVSCFNNYKFKLTEACLYLEKQIKTTKLIYYLLTWFWFKRKMVVLEQESNLCQEWSRYEAGLLKGDRSTADKIIICWWHLQKRSPWKFSKQ